MPKGRDPRPMHLKAIDDGKAAGGVARRLRLAFLRKG